ncbi:MAG: VanZ family protein [Acidobacteria bacterium]|nr:VanZ family protein [Acidobacteriota bacterium]
MKSNAIGSWRRHTLAWLHIWWPVIFCGLVIARESTPAFSGAHTSRLLRPLLTYLFGPIADASWEHFHLILRKSGHFTWYGFTGLAFLRAWRMQWRGHLFGKKLVRRASWMAICCTMLMASMDELHQSYLSERTGLVSDVLLDTAGAITMIMLVWFVSAVRSRRPA